MKSIYLCFLILFIGDLWALNISDYISPHNKNRKLRKRTDYIILHTTEGAVKGALRKVHEAGAIHYLVSRKGNVYRIIDRDRVAEHAGTSMWKGKCKINRYSVGIELVGYHDGNISTRQYAALKELVRQLQSIYNISDENVLTHSMVAYGEANRWHKKPHRGRKRCGMLFALDPVRRRIGLDKRPLYDPDVKSRRLINADAYLAKILYGKDSKQDKAFKKLKKNNSNIISKGRSAWDIARDNYNKSTTLYIFPDGRQIYGHRLKKWKAIPPGTRVITQKSQSEKEDIEEPLRVLGVDGNTASEVAGEKYNAETTIYFFPKGEFLYGHMLKEKDFSTLPLNTKVLVGYSLAGKITENKRAFDILSAGWDDPCAYYRYPDGKLLAGNQVKDTAMPEDSLVFIRS